MVRLPESKKGTAATVVVVPPPPPLRDRLISGANQAVRCTLALGLSCCHHKHTSPPPGGGGAMPAPPPGHVLPQFLDASANQTATKTGLLGI